MRAIARAIALNAKTSIVEYPMQCFYALLAFAVVLAITATPLF